MMKKKGGKNATFQDHVSPIMLHHPPCMPHRPLILPTKLISFVCGGDDDNGEDADGNFDLSCSG